MKTRILKASCLLIVLAFMVTAGAFSAACEEEAGEVLLTLTKGTETQTFTLKDLKDLPAVEGTCSFMNSVGEIIGPCEVKGVALEDICESLGGLSPSEAAKVMAKDGYAMTLSANQITSSGFTTFNVSTKEEVDHGDLTVMIAYEQDGEPIDPDSQGPLRLVIMGAEDEATEGHWWVKWVTDIEIVELESAWTLTLTGAVTEEMDSNTFEAGAAPGCHGASVTDDKDRVWEGIPLYLLLGRVDDDNTHMAGAFNDDLADAGYDVIVTASDGYSKTFSSAEIPRDDTWIVAYKLDGQLIDDEDKNWPLKLVGLTVPSQCRVGAIAEIEIVFP